MESKQALICAGCRKELKAGEGYTLGSETFCAACCMEARTTRARKTHWQYLRSIKNEYLRPSESNAGIKPKKGDAL